MRLCRAAETGFCDRCWHSWTHSALSNDCGDAGSGTVVGTVLLHRVTHRGVGGPAGSREGNGQGKSMFKDEGLSESS